MTYTSREVYEFISKQTNDPIVERKTCAVSGQEFAIYQSDLDFYAKISPTFGGQRFQIPTPNLCPEERQRRRMLFRNERKLYKRKCDFSGKDIISIYSPDKPYKVYDQKIRRSDDWNPMEYGFDFDFSKTFIEQFANLQLQVPRASVLNGFSENADYCNHSYYNKNSYMLAACANCEDCLYNTYILTGSNCVDVDYGSDIHHCYNSFRLDQCYACMFCTNCANCTDCMYCEDCKGCNNCFNCFGLVNKQFYVNNEFVGKDQFEHYIKYNKSKIPLLKIKQNMSGFNNIDSLGSYLNDSKHAIMCNLSKEIENSKYLLECNSTKSAMDSFVSWGGCELLYETHCCVTYHVAFSNVVREGSKIFYCDNLLDNANECFGCIGLKKSKHCIFNKQYTKDAYEITVAKIIAHMQETGERGEFFHGSLSPFGYNETVAQEYFPLTREEALARGYTRQDNNYDPVIPAGASILDWKVINDISINDDEILKSIFLCEVSSRPYRIIKQELEFYRKHHLPLPRKHPDVRHQERMNLRPGRILYLRNCDKTGEQILSVYPPDYPGKVYSEKAYLAEVY